MAEPYPKAKQLARGERRYRRKIASEKQWQAIIAEKGDVCRVCASWEPARDSALDMFPRVYTPPIEYHHLVARSLCGDDDTDNIVPLCLPHHTLTTLRSPETLRRLSQSLTEAEYEYVRSRLGEDGPRRLFGV